MAGTFLKHVVFGAIDLNTCYVVARSVEVNNKFNVVRIILYDLHGTWTLDARVDSTANFKWEAKETIAPGVRIV